MNRPLSLLPAFALLLLGCGHYGPPERPGPEQVAPAEPSDEDDDESRERTP